MDQKEKTQNEYSRRARLLDIRYELFELIAVVVLAVLAVITVSEMASRESFSNSISSKISSLNVDLANIAINPDATMGKLVYEQRQEVTIKISAFEELNDGVSTLINVGVSDKSGTLKALIESYHKATARFNEPEPESEKLIESYPKATARWPSLILKELSNYINLGFVYEKRSDHLLALSIICCSALGAMIFGLRSGSRMSVRTLTSGLATGFVVYLALKGGQHLFLLTSPDVRIPSNPYSMHLLGYSLVFLVIKHTKSFRRWWMIWHQGS